MMQQTTPRTQRWTAFWHRWYARRAGRWDGVTQFTRTPEPRQFGLAAKGRHLLAGDYLLSGKRLSLHGGSIWDIAPKHTADLHDCIWLDDLAALGSDAARDLAREWVFDWISRFGAGRGAGWDPAVTGQRLIRWIGHSDFILRKQDPQMRAVFLQSLGRQTVFAARRAGAAHSGLARMQALAGVIHASVMLDGFAPKTAAALRGLLAETARHIDAAGAIASRNPEELLTVFVLLTDIAQSLTGADQPVPQALTQTIHKIAPVLRGLRHSDGGLVRLHGGGEGIAGRLDAALATAGMAQPAALRPQMGFARLHAGRVSVIIDAAAPPKGSHTAHASTLGFELTSGRRPLIVSCGSGARFGADWHRASRATASHATLTLGDHSSAKIGPHGALIQTPSLVRADLAMLADGIQIETSHDGYRARYGLTHARVLHLSSDGRSLHGTDLLTTLDANDATLFDTAFDGTLRQGIGFAIRFHLHPQVRATLDPAGQTVLLRLVSGETWALSHDQAAQISLNPSVYLQNGQLKPRATQQVVLSGSALAYATRVRWSLAKTQDMPLALRDLVLATPQGDIEEP
jgi:uncharacterized heparinase superfamily protein